MSKSPVFVKPFIKNLEDLKDFECILCFDIDPFIRRCSGPCKSPICLRCCTAFNHISNNPKCPKRCCHQLKLERIPNIKFEFHCPYDKEKCTQKIVGIVAFHQHACDYITEKALIKQKRDLKYLCPKGHNLLFLDKSLKLYLFGKSSYECLEMPCSECGDKRISRSFCPECTSMKGPPATFCHDCCAIPCTKKSCPHGHPLVVMSGENMICDACGFDIQHYSGICYMDWECKFGFCINCRTMIPDNHPMVPLKLNTTYKKQYGKRIQALKKKTGSGNRRRGYRNRSDSEDEDSQQDSDYQEEE